MKKQYLGCAIVMSISLLAHAQEGTPSDLKKIQGKWTPKSLYLAQQLVPDEALPGFAVVFEGGRMTLKLGPDAISRVDFTLDSSKAPKSFDYVVPKEPGKGKTAHGIYELDGDKLKISIANYDEARPKDYSTPEKCTRVVMILQRVK